ncbi:protein ALP1-like [Senna tora]|uniref:Protein ALP1-like n=1 Tax=Senna tora TaxID=362788 RepID=A0A834TS93_9FABA|nr:protein ALP1-like [Senna tora]
MMLLVDELFKQLEPVPEDETDERWKWFKGCLGAIDGTHISIRVPLEDQGRCRNRKGEITTNVLGVCSRDGQFVYVLSGWEGSVADGRVLKDAIEWDDGLKVPRDQYYLVDAGFTNCRGFLAPYRGQRYHLNTWRQGCHPTSPQECFNMRYSSARNIQWKTTIARRYTYGGRQPHHNEPSDAWSAWRDRLATDMFDEFRGQRGPTKALR